MSRRSNMALARASLRLCCRWSSFTSARCISTAQASRAQFSIQDKEDFKSKVLESKKPVVVNFRATWCGPCKMLTPRLEAAVDARGEKVDLAKVDIDEQADLAFQYEVEAVPAVIMFKDGQVTDRFLGLKDKDQIESFLDKAVGS
ncbi:thioredoxin, mitochondrial [Rhipicephalus sanguineus]|uniref:thioredoxin, mitochondrial n=1 Tax=Rhipicephalus sanguineus TaxID=34632 RepID=UPI00189610E2|nr:thioredoxin, mitochondrial [Rhipicephalus sanguineus]